VSRVTSIQKGPPKFPRRRFLHLAAGATALPTVSRIAWAQAYPTRPVRIAVRKPAEDVGKLDHGD
jgi:hypothetical protein